MCVNQKSESRFVKYLIFYKFEILSDETELSVLLGCVSVKSLSTLEIKGPKISCHVQPREVGQTECDWICITLNIFSKKYSNTLKQYPDISRHFQKIFSCSVKSVSHTQTLDLDTTLIYHLTGGRRQEDMK